jgi:DNA-binding LytR/AlgR family response regulator
MSNKIRSLVVDDEKLARTLLVKYIEKLPTLELVATCKDPFEALKVMQSETIELIFLDIQMPELTGIEFVRALSRHPAIIFTTAYQEYALEGYQLDVVDYLIKPFRFNRFMQAVIKAGRRIRQEANYHPPAMELTASTPDPAYMLINANHITHKVPLREIRYIEGMKEYVAFHLSNRKIISLQSLKQLEAELPASRFLRIHKSYIVARDKVTAMDGHAVYLGKDHLPIGGSYKSQVQERLF